MNSRLGHGDTKVQDVVALLDRFVSCDSSNPGVGEAEMAGVVAEDARSRGFDVRVVEGAPGRPNLLIDVVAGPGPALALNGHLDTKAVGDARPFWNTDPWDLTIDGDRAYGVGTSDMKAGIAAMLIATERWARMAERGRVQLVFTADEEAGGEHGAALLSARGEIDADAMILGEPAGVNRSWDALYTISRGVTCFEVVVHGEQGHSGLSGLYRPSATVAAARGIEALADFRPSHPDVGGIRMSPAVNAAVSMEGGVYYGVHPGLASFRTDIRTVPGMEREHLTDELKELLDAALPNGITYELNFEEGVRGWCPPAGIDAGHPLVDSAQRAAREVLGHELPLAAYPGATDASHFALAGGVPCITAFGPGLLSVAHGANEHVPVDDLGRAVDLFEATIREYCTSPAS